jgi:carboxylesterase type B
MGGRLKATHSLEIPFAFDNLDKSGVDFFLGEGESPQHVADLMHTVWTEFIRHGDPGWMAYNSERRATMCFDDESTLQENPSAISREAWQGIR